MENSSAGIRLLRNMCDRTIGTAGDYAKMTLNQ